MVRRAWMVVAWILSLSIFAAPGFTESAGPRLRSVLADVKALEQPVTYTEAKIPLGELVQKVAADTGVPLVAVPEVADEPVAVIVKEIPARELLEQLADLLDYTWSRRTGHPTPNTPHPPSRSGRIWPASSGRKRSATRCGPT